MALSPDLLTASPALAAKHRDAPAGEWLARIRALGPRIEALATASDSDSELPRELVAMLDDLGVYALMAPREGGGGEADPSTLIDVISELSYWDGSTGWYAHAVMTGGSVAGAFLGDKAVAAIFPDGRFAHAAGQAAPSGKAVREGDGYRISGRYSFGSGCPNAQWLVGGFMLDEGQGPRMLIGLAPRETVRFHGNWDVIGLRGTGSYDFEITDQVLHADFFHDLAAPREARGGALYRMGFMALPCISHGAFAIGAARRVLDEWLAFAQGKVRAGGKPQSQQTIFQRDFAIATAELRSAEAWFRRTFERIYALAEAGQPIDDDLRLDGRLSTSHAFVAATRIANAAFASATTAAIRNGHPLQRAWRDIQAGNAHFLTAEQSLIDCGAVLAGAPGATLVF
jgi:alkylation response protein AidB-like acyl-CoA dehydrogenase